MVQNQKLRCTASLGVSSPSHRRLAGARVVDDVVEPVEEHGHPADAALAEGDVERGKRSGIRAHSQSAAAATPLTGNSVGSSSSGAPGDCAAVHDADPVWRQMTVPVSSHAASSGSQWSVCTDGSPMLTGCSGNESALNPRAAFRRTSAAAISGSLSQVICSGMIRSG